MVRERLLEKLRENVRNEEMKLVLLKKLRQSQTMKENVGISQSSNNSSSNLMNGVGNTSSVTGTNSSGAVPLPPPQSPHNNHIGASLHGVGLSSGGKGRSSPKLSSGTNLSINPKHGTPAGQIGGLGSLRLSQHGVTGLGLNAQQGNNSHHRQHGSPSKGLNSNSSKLPSLLKGVSS